MQNIRAFLRDKGLYLVSLGLIFAATATGIWAVRRVVQNVNEFFETTQEEPKWQPDVTVNQPVTDLPKPTLEPYSGQPSGPQSSSAPQSESGSSSETAAASAEPSAQPSDLLTVPVAGAYTLGGAFSGEELVRNDTLGDWRTHNGQDYLCEFGTPVLNCRAGVVNAAYMDAVWGGVVKVNDADGRTWVYCGLKPPTLTKGAELHRGDVLGAVGNLPGEAGESTHLHLECREGENWLDPVELLAG